MRKPTRATGCTRHWRPCVLNVNRSRSRVVSSESVSSGITRGFWRKWVRSPGIDDPRAEAAGSQHGCLCRELRVALILSGMARKLLFLCRGVLWLSSLACRCVPEPASQRGLLTVSTRVLYTRVSSVLFAPKLCTSK